MTADGGRARHRDDRRARACPGAEGHGHGRDGSRGRDRDPRLLLRARLGPPVGACRMCLVEVQGHAEAAGRLHAHRAGRHGRAHRAHLRAGAPRAQNSTLEFILVNHPLDCPVCDKGGECPLQDLTFRYGPGNTRMTFPKRTFEKPIPISPLIALDRERCILCYRCTRFSEQVAEDGQLVAINRGAQSVIATFEDEPYRGHFSGNVTELCPVGALTSTQYRFEARPWEIQNVPDRLRALPRRLQHLPRRPARARSSASSRATIPRSTKAGCATRAASPTRTSTRATASTTPLRKAGPRRFEELSWDDALDRAEEMLRAGGTSTVTALSGGESVEEAYALGKLLRAGARRERGRPARGGARTGSTPARAPLSALRDAKTIAVVCDEPVVERAPVVDLWLKAARRAGATITYGAPAGTVDALVTDQPEPHVGADERLLPAAHAERPRRRRRLERRRRRRADRRAAARSSSSRATRRRPTRPCASLAADARPRDRDRHVRGQLPRLRRSRPAGHELPRARRDDGQPRGPAAASAPRRARTGARRARLDREARRALRRRALAARVGRLRRGGGEVLRRDHVRRGRRARRRCRPRAERALRNVSSTSKMPDTAGGLRLVAYRPLFSGAAVDRTPELQFQRPGRRGRALAGGCEPRARSATARRSRSLRTARRSSCARGSRAISPPAPCASRASTPPTCTRPSRSGHDAGSRGGSRSPRRSS